MSIRQSAFGLLRIIRYGHRTVTASSSGRSTNALIQTGKMELSSECGVGCRSWKNQYTGCGEFYLWFFLSGQAVILGMNSCPVLAEDVSIHPNSEKDLQAANLTGLQKIDDGSVISNTHTSKWRVFTDNGRDLFLQGKLAEAELLFLSALEEAKEGFGERDPHVASSYNNLAELYRVKRVFDKAEPLYLEAVKILEESFGPEDIRVGASLHNLGQFYLVQRKLEKAHPCYERALKIKRRIMGHDNTDYADTMYHLGIVLYLQGKEDSESLIQDSIKIMEEGGLGESNICLRRLRYLAQIYMRSNQLAKAENVQRKVLHIMELSKGWNSLDTVIAAEGLGLTLQSAGKLREAKDLLERCLEVRKIILPEDHVQIVSNMFYIARVEMLNFNQLRMANTSEAVTELDRVKDRLLHCIRISQKILNKSATQEGKQQYSGVSRQTGMDEHAAHMILVQSLNVLGGLEISKQELLQSKKQDELSPAEGKEDSVQQFISAFNMLQTEGSMFISSEFQSEYLSCLKNFLSLISSDRMHRGLLDMLKDEIKRVEDELSKKEKCKALSL